MAHPRLHRSSVEKTNENAFCPFMVSGGIVPLFVQRGLQWRKGIKKHRNSGCAKAYFHIIFRNGPENRPDRQSTRPSETDFSKKGSFSSSSRLFFFPHPGKQTPGRRPSLPPNFSSLIAHTIGQKIFQPCPWPPHNTPDRSVSKYKSS